MLRVRMNTTSGKWEQLHRSVLAAAALLLAVGAGLSGLTQPLSAQQPGAALAGRTGAVEAGGSAHAGKDAGAASATASSAAPAYTLGPGDVVAIDVWHEPEISRSLPVQPDGRLSLPLAGQMHVAGLTTAQLEDLITARLKQYIDHPAVTVMLQQAESRRYNIVDMVAKPGTYPLIQPTTVLDAIAQAGGLRDFAHPKKIYVIRKRASDGVEVRFNFNYEQVSRGLHMEQNIRLQPGDTVVVP